MFASWHKADGWKNSLWRTGCIQLHVHDERTITCPWCMYNHVFQVYVQAHVPGACTIVCPWSIWDVYAFELLQTDCYMEQLVHLQRNCILHLCRWMETIQENFLSTDNFSGCGWRFARMEAQPKVTNYPCKRTIKHQVCIAFNHCGPPKAPSTLPMIVQKCPWNQAVTITKKPMTLMTS